VLKKLDIMRFIMEIFPSFSTEIGFVLAYFLYFQWLTSASYFLWKTSKGWTIKVWNYPIRL